MENKRKNISQNGKNCKQTRKTISKVGVIIELGYWIVLPFLLKKSKKERFWLKKKRKDFSPYVVRKIIIAKKLQNVDLKLHETKNPNKKTIENNM